MLTPILHIGFPKTSSTWFQDQFYPSITNINYIDRKIVQDLFLKPAAFDWKPYDCKKIIGQLSYGKNERLVLCEELLLGRLRPGGVRHFVTKEIANRLKNTFDSAEIVIFIRNQLDILSSAYMQYIQSGGNYNINKFLYPNKISGGDYNSLVLLGVDYFEYHKVIDYYAQLFGMNNIHIYLYEDFNSDKEHFVNDFCEKFNLLMDHKLLSYNKLNERYRSALIPLRKLASILTRNGPLNKYYLVNIPYFDRHIKPVFFKANKYKIFGKPQKNEKILGKRNIQFLMEYYSKSNQILIDKYGLTKIKIYNYPL